VKSVHAPLVVTLVVGLASGCCAARALAQGDVSSAWIRHCLDLTQVPRRASPAARSGKKGPACAACFFAIGFRPERHHCGGHRELIQYFSAVWVRCRNCAAFAAFDAELRIIAHHGQGVAVSKTKKDGMMLRLFTILEEDPNFGAAREWCVA